MYVYVYMCVCVCVRKKKQWTIRVQYIYRLDSEEDAEDEGAEKGHDDQRPHSLLL